ncbi:unnamed protein product [Ilex paraguariensis]|uniref:C2H2-type domain-containing protein n=2 Tax=Ilex paraguariensis TaxID=185542 RepID=A0ABC8TA95_9AQUA
MEADQPAPETIDQAVVCSTDEQGPNPQARTYECTFCKRGFSNAQALGGHMNIHRKDKAKIKQASNEAQQFLDIPKTTPTYRFTNLQALEVKSIQEKSPINWPWNLSPEEDVTSRYETHVGELPLSSETTSRIENQEPNSSGGATTEKGLQAEELDLELRLGHEFQEPSATLGTRKFF